MFKNTFKTAVLLAGLGGLIVGLSALIGGGNPTYLMIGLVLALVTVGASYWFSDKLALRSAGAQVVTEAQAPEFYAMIRRLAQRADLPMPTVAISPADQPNAFATGRNPNNAVVCATQGLLRSMPADEVEAVMAHELMHVKHRDILIGSVAAGRGHCDLGHRQHGDVRRDVRRRSGGRGSTEPAGGDAGGDGGADRRRVDADGDLPVP